MTLPTHRQPQVRWMWLGLLALAVGCYKPRAPLGRDITGGTGTNGAGGMGDTVTGGALGGRGSSARSGPSASARSTAGTGSTGLGFNASTTGIATASFATSGASFTSTTAGPTTGSTGACAEGTTGTALTRCATTPDCACPLECYPSNGRSLCELPCTTTLDCPELSTTCVEGVCQPNFCGPSSTAGSGTLDGTCNALGRSDGSCIPTSFLGENVGLCSQGGQATSACDPQATRDDLGGACPAGDYCLAQGDGGTCLAMCDPFGADSCAAGDACQTLLPGDARLGLCAPEGTSSSSSTRGSSSGSTGASQGSTGSTGGSSTGSSGSTGNGCSSSIPPSEFQSCTRVEDCGCPMSCVFDPGGGGKVCEYTCESTSQCPDLVTQCKGGVCAITACGPGTGNGSFNSTCNVVGTNDGTCEPLTLDGGSSFGYCSQAGTATSSCDPGGTRNDLSSVCPAGSMCYGGALTFGGQCNQLCDPFAGGPCPGVQFCSPIVQEPDLGICVDSSGF